MINIMRVPAAYFLSLATIILDDAGTVDALGTSYADERCTIRRSVDGGTIVVDMKDIDRDNKGGTVATRTDGVDALMPGNAYLASHLEHRASRAFKGEHVFSFALRDAAGTETVRHVAGTSLSDAKRIVRDGPEKLDILDLVGGCSPEAFASRHPVGTPVSETPDVARGRAHAVRLEEAGGSDHEVYSIKWRDGTDAGRGSIREDSPMRAINLADAEATFRLNHPDDRQRIIGIAIAPLLDFLTKSGPRVDDPIASQGVKAERSARSPDPADLEP